MSRLKTFISRSLTGQLMCSVLISLLVAGFTFGASFFLGNAFLNNTVYSDSFEKRITNQHFERLQNHINTESISLSKIHRLNGWCSQEDKLYITIYSDSKLLYESPVNENASESMDQEKYTEFDPELENPANQYELTLADGTKVCAFIYHYAGYLFYLFVSILSGILAFIAFSLCFIILINRKLSYIKSLKHELEILSGGQLEYPITIKGYDELGELAIGIEQMRRSILRHMEIENQMRSDNSTLITSMSHDLRTPLTSLLAYLEIVKRKKFSDEEQMYELINKSIDKTIRIRDMADKLFEYFLVYATEWECDELEVVAADKFFDQFLCEYAYSLENHNIKVHINHSELVGDISVNMPLLQRLFDNIYSNLLKYADREQPITISYNDDSEHIILTIVNSIGHEHEKRNSTGIGLKTCSRIMQYHEGHFEIYNDNSKFSTTIKIPIIR